MKDAWDAESSEEEEATPEPEPPAKEEKKVDISKTKEVKNILYQDITVMQNNEMSLQEVVSHTNSNVNFLKMNLFLYSCMNYIDSKEF